MYMHMCTYTHTHRALIRSVTRGWILQGPSAGIAFSQSHLFCFPMGGSARRDKHGRGVLATASSPGRRRWLRGAGGFRAEPRQTARGQLAPGRRPRRRHFAGGTANAPARPAGRPSLSPPTRPRPVPVVTPIAFLLKSNEKPEIPR